VIIIDLLKQRLFLSKDSCDLSYRMEIQIAFHNTLYILNILTCIRKIPGSILHQNKGNPLFFVILLSPTKRIVQ